MKFCARRCNKNDGSVCKYIVESLSTMCHGDNLFPLRFKNLVDEIKSTSLKEFEPTIKNGYLLRVVYRKYYTKDENKVSTPFE